MSANPNAGPYDGVASVTTGTSNPPYNVFTEKDPGTSVALQYQSITCMPAYRGTSLEELRFQDYQQGRKTAGAFGQTTFGAPAAQPAAGGTGLFGQPAAPTTTQPTSSLFGGFGNNNAAGATPANNTGAFGSFGQPTQPAAGTSGSSLFGGAFGQPQQQQQQQQPQQQTNAFGAFGQPQPQQQQQPATGGLFGGGAFGTQNQQPKPFGTFGESVALYTLISTLQLMAFARNHASYWTDKCVRRFWPDEPATTACCYWNRIVWSTCSAATATATAAAAAAGQCVWWFR
jgi:nuclear pore complex protein Nup98-Nup96